MKKFLMSLALIVGVQSQAAFGVSIDLTFATLAEKNENAILLNNVRFGDLKSPVWALFQWDAKANSLVLQTIGNEDSNANEIPAGNWDLQYDWDCNGGAISTPIIVNADHTLSTPKEGPYTAKWSMDQGQVRWVYDQSPHAVYTGKYDGKGKIEGTMVANSMKGCFKAIFSQDSTLTFGFSAHDSAGK